MSHSVELNGNLYFPTKSKCKSCDWTCKICVYRWFRISHTTATHTHTHTKHAARSHPFLAASLALSVFFTLSVFFAISVYFSLFFPGHIPSICGLASFIFRANCILTRAYTKFYGCNWKWWLFGRFECVCVSCSVVL